VLLAYPHTDACKTQIGAVMSQNGKPIAFHSRKMNRAQQNYAVTEKELLSIVATLKEFRNILLGQQITVFTDHKNLTYKNFNTERVMRWRLVLEEFGPDLQHIKGERNVVADALSRPEQDIVTSANASATTMTISPLLAPSHYGIRTSPKCNWIIQHCY
jgi:hypothetical protein